ncbi:rRNA-binding ribosome biosynthesis protein rpf2 [Tieghemiomyces parasiticus]|uniref:Ribosome production factor 2 homolog n=1 Tax=Tieghemiomyces parasiticus TaxID=78921 RepID=A0A9W7ZFQ4_9FUNG|nr:rRNA-binding ribosome biosynthesis protein rpf2 [Tieghemiomyces parasiticus]
MLRVIKPKNARSKRFLENREPKVNENPKQALFIRGSSTSEIIKDTLQAMYDLRKPNAVHFTRKNEVHPFDDETKLEFFLRKNDTAHFMLGNHSKKRPHNLTIGRAFDHQIMDMIELGIEYAVPSYVFDSVKMAVGARPLFLFQGEAFEYRDEYRKLKSLLVDFFHGTIADGVDLEGIQHLISVTAGPISEDSNAMVTDGGAFKSATSTAGTGLIFFRVFTIELKKSGTKTPRVETKEMGPALNLRIRRTKFADDKTMYEATRVPAENRNVNVKNVSRDVFGDKYGRIHLGDQKLDSIQTRKMKALKLTRSDKKRSQGTAEEADE